MIFFWVIFGITAMVFIDYYKPPVDRLYFNRPLRPVVAIRNCFFDMFLHKHSYKVEDYNGLWLLKAHFDEICEEFYMMESEAKKTYFHDDDSWFPVNEDYYFYKVKDFPGLYDLIDNIPCVEKDTGIIAVMESPMYLPTHRAETNIRLRYQLVLQGNEQSVLHTFSGDHPQETREEILFDHALQHSVSNNGKGRRVVLLLNIHRT